VGADGRGICFSFCLSIAESVKLDGGKVIDDWTKETDRRWTHNSGRGTVQLLGGAPDTWVAWWAFLEDPVHPQKLGMFWDKLNPSLGLQMALGCVERAKATEEYNRDLKVLEAVAGEVPKL
jgi:hypothetical protein